MSTEVEIIWQAVDEYGDFSLITRADPPSVLEMWAYPTAPARWGAVVLTDEQAYELELALRRRRMLKPWQGLINKEDREGDLAASP